MLNTFIAAEKAKPKVTTQYGQLPGSTKSGASALKEASQRTSSAVLSTEAPSTSTSHVFFFKFFNYFFFQKIQD